MAITSVTLVFLLGFAAGARLPYWWLIAVVLMVIAVAAGWTRP